MDGNELDKLFNLLTMILVNPWLISVLILVLLIILALKKVPYFIVSHSIFGFIQSLFQGKLGQLLLFENRDDSKNAFLNDIKKSKKLMFYGVNHSSMQRYLVDAKGDSTAKWETMHFYFANNKYGRIIRNDHEKRIRESILMLSMYLAKEKQGGKLPNLKDVFFYQCKNTYHFGGSFFEFDDQRLNAIHVVLYFPEIANCYLEKNITLRINQKKNDLYNKAKASFEYISNPKEVITLHTIDFTKYNYWDESADSLYKLQTNQLFYNNIKDNFFTFCSIKQEDTILDLGSGTGFFYESIVDQISKGEIVLVDKSSAMLDKSMDVLHDHNNVKYILSDVLSDKLLYGDFESTIFSKIIIFYAFPYFVTDRRNINSLVLKLKKYLAEDGEILIMIHNSFIADDQSNDNQKWDDPIRKEIKAKANQMHIVIKDETHHIFTVDEIKDEFSKVGFVNVGLETKKYERTLQDRIEMWKVPAILNSLIDVQALKEKEIICSDFMDEVFYRVDDKTEMPPTTAYFFRFKRNPKNVIPPT